MNKHSKTFRLFTVIPSLIIGAASVLDMGATFNIYNMDQTVTQADGKAIAADWQMVGEDLRVALEQYGAKNVL